MYERQSSGLNAFIIEYLIERLVVGKWGSTFRLVDIFFFAPLVLAHVFFSVSE